MPHTDNPVTPGDGFQRVACFAGVAALLQRGSPRRYMRRFESQTQHFRGLRVEGPVFDITGAVLHLLHHGAGAQNVIDAGGREFRNGAHGPLKMTHIVRVAVAEPVIIVVIHAAAGDPAVGAGKIGSVVQGAESVIASLPVARLLEEQGTDRGPACGMVALAGARAATETRIRRTLFVNGLRAEE